MVKDLREDGISLMEPEMPKAKLVRTTNGQGLAEPVGFDFKSLDGMKPYKESEPLPEPIITTNRRGVRVLKKEGEPRYYFNGNELIMIRRGLGGKKRSLKWIYRKGKPMDIQIRKYLRNMGIPGA